MALLAASEHGTRSAALLVWSGFVGGFVGARRNDRRLEFGPALHIAIVLTVQQL